MSSDRTTIQLSRSTRDKLADLGRKGDSFEDILLKLIDYWNEGH